MIVGDWTGVRGGTVDGCDEFSGWREIEGELFVVAIEGSTFPQHKVLDERVADTVDYVTTRTT